MRTRTPRGHRTTHRTVAVTFGAAVALAAGQLGAAAAALPFDRGIDDACDDNAADADQFSDVAPDDVHATAINCLWVYGVVQGRFVDGENRYSPADAVTREQMASFVATMVDQLPVRSTRSLEQRMDPTSMMRLTSVQRTSRTSRACRLPASSPATRTAPSVPR